MMPTRRYAQSQNETASPERLMVLLFEAALRHMRAAMEALRSGRAGDANTALSKATDIVVELDATFDRRRAPDLADNLGVVYQFVCGRLLTASTKRDPTLVREAEQAFFPVADAFATAVRQLAAERAAQEAAR
jgi:flagellar secretion chaperone FliS